MERVLKIERLKKKVGQLDLRKRKLLAILTTPTISEENRKAWQEMLDATLASLRNSSAQLDKLEHEQR